MLGSCSVKPIVEITLLPLLLPLSTHLSIHLLHFRLFPHLYLFLIVIFPKLFSYFLFEAIKIAKFCLANHNGSLPFINSLLLASRIMIKINFLKMIH